MIIYLDILGFEDFVNYTSESRLDGDIKIERINKFLNMIKRFFSNDAEYQQLSKSKEITCFSDLVVISIKTEEIELIEFELSEIVYLLLNCIANGFLIRGSIVYGKLIHNKKVLFGPGLIKAYRNERKNAKYPRVIIENAIIKDIYDLADKKDDVYLGDTKNSVSIDQDGYYFIDFTTNTRHFLDNFGQYIIIIKALTGILIDIVDNPSLKEKYLWLVGKYIRMIENEKIFNYGFNKEILTLFDLQAFSSYLYSEFNELEFENKL